MLHNLNFLDWRSAQSRKINRYWVGVIGVTACVFVLFQWRVYHDHQWSIDHNQQHYQQTKSAYNLVMTQYQQAERKHQQIKQKLGDLSQWQQWIEMSQQPLQVMDLVQRTVADGVYLDRIVLSGREMTVDGVVNHETEAANFAQALSRDAYIEQVFQLRLDSQQSRWQGFYHAFELRTTLRAKVN
jgi:type IV pilus assembly protein PilN